MFNATKSMENRKEEIILLYAAENRWILRAAVVFIESYPEI